MRLLPASLAAVLFGTAALSSAWNDTGHMVIATIAAHDLSPTVRAEIAGLLEADPLDPAPIMMLASTWADENRSPQSAPWHYINLHFRTDRKRTSNQPEAENVAVAVERFRASIADRSLPPAQRKQALLYLLHFVADAHQPLHAVARDTDRTPEGDRGGNDFAIKPPAELKGLPRPPQNLHALWDVGAGLFWPEPKPYEASAVRRVRAQAVSLRSALPRSSFRAVRNLDPMAWAREGLAVAKRTVYRLEEDAEPSPQYMEQARILSAQRATLAGYRLADILNKALG